MKVLIVSENFFKGGLEKQIINQYKTLNGKVEYVFALSNYDNTFLNDKNVYKLKDDYSLISLVENIKVLIKIIEKENIDVIHVHPYYSIFPTMFASQIKNIPICTTVHGINSLNFPKSTNIKLLQRLFYSELKPLVFSVNKNFDNVLKNNYYITNIKYLPNTINTKEYENIKAKGNKWVLISRLDEDKYLEIKLVIENFKNLNLKYLDIFGTGTKKEELELLVKKHNLDKYIKFKGYDENISKVLSSGYTGVIGLGQVVLEASASGLPILLIGYGKITGLVDKKRFNEIKDVNFINRFLVDDDISIIGEKIKNIYKNYNIYNLKEELGEFDNSILIEKYFNEIKKHSFVKSNEIINVFSELNNLYLNGEIALSEDIFNSNILFEILKNNFRNKVILPEIIDLFDNHENMLNIKNNFYKCANENELFFKSIGLKTVSKNTMNTVKNKINHKNKKQKLVAVCCVKNEEKYLPGFLNHIREYVDFVVVLDDGSTDKTLDLLKKDPLVKKIIKKEYHKTIKWNEVGNREEVINEAKRLGADWIICCDPDEENISLKVITDEDKFDITSLPKEDINYKE